jgi:hypothetical protein
MSERPILFSVEMVRAILEGRKTQTRRVVKPQPVQGEWGWDGEVGWIYKDEVFFDDDQMKSHLFHNVYGDKGSPYGSIYGNGPADELWVRETWGTEVRWGTTKPSDLPRDIKIYYRTDGEGQSGLDQWRPSIFMPRWASRIQLSLTDVRVERLWEISETECQAEGIAGDPDEEMLIPQFHRLWDRINAKRGFPWKSNPWVWVVEFELKQPTYAEMMEQEAHYRDAAQVRALGESCG